MTNSAENSSSDNISKILTFIASKFGADNVQDALQYAQRNGSLFDGKFSVLLPSGDVLDVENVSIPGYEGKHPTSEQFFVSECLLEAQTLAAFGIVLIANLPETRLGDARNVFSLLTRDTEIFLMASPLEDDSTESAKNEPGFFDAIDDFIARVDVRSTEIFKRVSLTWSEEAPKVESALTNVVKRVLRDITQ